MSRVEKFTRRDWLVAVILLAVGVALRVPCRSQYAYHWDSAQFALAIREYNVALSQPHAPGYFLYVMLGRLVNFFVGDPHPSLVWMSVVFGSAMAAMLFLLGAALFDRRVGVAAGLFAMTSPQVWFHSCVALTYVVDGFLVCVLVLCCWRAMQRGGTWGDAALIGTLLAVIGGVRQQTVPALAVLVVFTFWKFSQQRAAKLAVAATVAAVGGAAWFVPMIRMSGGWALYLEIVRRHAAFNAPATLARGGWPALSENLTWVTTFCANGLMLGAVLVVAGLAYRIVVMDSERRITWTREHGRALGMLAAWLGPMVLFGTVIGFTKQPGYVLSYLPVLLLLAAVVAAQLRRRWAFVSATAIVCAANVFAFAAWPRSWDGVFSGAARTAREVRQHDKDVEQTVRAIRAQFRPADVVVCHAAEYYLFGLRHFQLHLPEYDHYQMIPDPTVVSPPGKALWRTRGGSLEFVGRLDTGRKRWLLLVVPRGADVNMFAPLVDVRRAHIVSQSGRAVFSVAIDDSGAENF